MNSNFIKSNSFKILYNKEKKENLKKIVEFHNANDGMSRFDKIAYINKEILKKNFKKKEINKYILRFNKISSKLLLKSQYIPGVVNFMRKYHKTKYLIINSAAPTYEIEDFIKKKIINKFIKKIYGSPSTKFYNFNKIFKINKNIKISELIFFGDSLSDYMCAKTFKIDFIGINYDKLNKLNKLKNKIHVLNDFKEIY